MYFRQTRKIVSKQYITSTGQQFASYLSYFFQTQGLRIVPSRWHCPAPSIEKFKRRRGQEGKRAREQEGKRARKQKARRRCEDVRM